MEISWYGLSCFRLTERSKASVVTDPFGSKVGLGTLKLKADIVTSSHDAVGHNNLSAVAGYDFAITGPGEFEIGGVFVTGLSTGVHEGKRNTMYLFNFGNVSVGHLGDIRKVPSQSQIEALGAVDILLLPVGGGQSLNATKAAEMVSMIEPKIVIPMHYSVDKLKVELDDVQPFLNEMGQTEVEPVASFKSGSMPDETQTVLLMPKSAS